MYITFTCCTFVYLIQCSRPNIRLQIFYVLIFLVFCFALLHTLLFFSSSYFSFVSSSNPTFSFCSLPSSSFTRFSRDGLRYEEESEPDSPPIFVIQPNPVQAEEGNPARFLVKVSGIPMPKVQWLINDGIIGNVSVQTAIATYTPKCVYGGERAERCLIF